MLVGSNIEIERVVNDTTLSEAVAACVFYHIGIDKRVFDSAQNIYYISTTEKKVVDCTFDLIVLAQKLMNEHVTFVNYNRPTDLIHVYTYALIKEDNNPDWYNIQYIQIQIETEYPVEVKCYMSNDVVLIPTQNECIDIVDFLETQIFDIENFGPFSADSEFLWFIAQDKHYKKFKLKNPQHIMAEILSRKLRFSLDEGWEVVTEKDHAGDFLHLTRGKDDYILISCVSKHVTMSGDKSNNLIECITSLGYTFDPSTTRIDQKHPCVPLEEVECVYECLYISWLYNKYAQDIKVIDEYRDKNGSIQGIVKESIYCYRIWGGRGPTQLIQNPVSLNVILMRELLANGYQVKRVDYDDITLEKKDDNNVKVTINTTKGGDGTVTAQAPIVPLEMEHKLAGNLAVKINYVMVKNEIVETRSKFDDATDIARLNLIYFLNTHPTIKSTKETPEEFLKLKSLLNNLYAAHTGIKFMDFQLKNPSRFFSSVKISNLLRDCDIPFTIESTVSNGTRLTVAKSTNQIIIEGDVNTDTKECTEEPAENEGASEVGDFVLLSHNEDGYNSIL